MSSHEDLTPAERSALSSLPSSIEAPTHLEDEVIRALRKRRLLVSGAHWWHAPRPGVWAVAIAASIAALALGIGVGRASVDTSLPRASFIIFLHAGPEYVPDTDANFPLRFEDYNRWVAETRRSGNFITGEQLDRSGMVLLPRDGEPAVETRISPGPDGDVLGMFLITANDYEEARRVAGTLPHLEYGGRVTIRRVSPI